MSIIEVQDQYRAFLSGYGAANASSTSPPPLRCWGDAGSVADRDRHQAGQRGPLLFSQARWAGGTRSFPALKFRTMHVNAEQLLKELLEADPVLRHEYEMYHKLTRDPRVTRFGRILRKLSFDELPQLWNVLIGDMSLIGPRPYMPHELVRYPHQQEVLARVRPGITGLWQVSGRHRTTFEDRLQLDIAYVEGCTLRQGTLPFCCGR